MIFKDEVKIEVKAGKGGDGAATFRREKSIQFGGPDGGDGGDGGNVVIKVNPHLRTLSHIHNNQKFRAEEGGKGLGNKMFGKKGENFIIEVPEGTIVINSETGELVCDLTKRDDEFVVAKGGKYGKGNVHFKSSTNQSPFYAQKGKPGETFKLMLELKMIAHIGLVGFPNAGKSSLVAKITNARPKIANYPFTTLMPNIGVMTIDDKYTSLLIADIPGLIEGAHKGKGLGIEFLKHIERTSVILYILDAADEPEKKFKILKNELKSYSNKLFERDYIIALNKTDLLYDEKMKAKVKKSFALYAKKLFWISALTGEGLKELKIALYKHYQTAEKKSKPKL
jgi:GTPase